MIKIGQLLVVFVNRITEVGQKTENNFKQDSLFSTIFGDTIMGFHNPLAISPTNFLTWVTDGSGYRTQVNRTYYDVQAILPQSVLQQQELRNRVASTTYSDTLWTDTFKFNNATHYSYDVHGNVKTLIQDDSVIGIPGERYKRVDYQYDLVSGKVNQVDYENDSLDAYHQIYQYDADNRITSVFTSRDSILWDNDANYFYYAHGPLGREEIGDQQVQGIDYAYTLQGWLKGVNSDLLDSNRDMGNDGLQNATNLNRYFAQDAFGYSLKYFTGDYNAINQTIWNDNVSKFEANYYNSDLMNSRHDLFNGNITAMVTDIQQPQAYSQTIANQNTIPLPQGTAYNYDQLNRLIEMYAFQNLDTSNSWENTGVYNGSFNNWFTYDENGNILTQKRADQLGNVFDSLSYNYNVQSGLALQNRLYGVNNAVSIANSMPDDGPFSDALSTINQVNNYRYTAMGELAEDITGQLDTVVWNVYGKVWRIKQRNGDSLTFFYDTKGDRIEKDYYTARPVSDVKTYYVRDAQGNILAIYTAQGGAPIVGTLGTGISSTSTPIIKYTLAERDIYGSKRIGADFTPVQLIGALPVSMIDTFGRYLGMKQYEMDNHLGNVLTTVSDRKIPISLDTTTGTAVDHYEADIISSQDYYPFGMEEPGRNFNSSTYRFGFNGKLKDDDIYGAGNSYDYGARMEDPRLGRWWTIDPLCIRFPNNSPYQFGQNDPLFFIDLGGLTDYTFHIRTFIPEYTVAMWRGDGRNFSTDLSVTTTSRISQQFTLNTDETKLINEKTKSSPSAIFLPSPGYLPSTIEKSANPSFQYSNVNSMEFKGSNKKDFVFDTHYSGSDPLAPLAPTIKYNNYFRVVEDKDNGLLHVDMTVSGTKYPADEAFLSDPKGNVVFLGVRGEEGSIGSDYLSSNKTLIQSKIDIIIDKEGNFTGVKENNKSYSLNEWNKQFEKVDAKKNETRKTEKEQ